MADERHCEPRATLVPFNLGLTVIDRFECNILVEFQTRMAAVRTFCLALRFMKIIYQPSGLDM